LIRDQRISVNERIADAMNDPDEVAAAVARNLADHRRRRGLSLEQLAQRSGVSKGMLVQIEQGRTNPSIATLCRVANALGVAVARFVEVGEAPTVRLVRAAEAPVLWRGADEGFARLLVGSDAPDCVELWEWRIAPGDAFSGEAHPAGTRELLHVLEGDLDLEIEQRRQRVGTGDSVIFRADRPHRYANAGAALLRLIMVVAEPTPGDTAP
jgi:transcriptional regulator with XRE-family HTH domain